MRVCGKYLENIQLLFERFPDLYIYLESIYGPPNNLCIRFGNTEFNHAEIAEKTGWKVRIRKSTTKPSNTIQAIKYQLKVSSSERVKHLKQTGEQIFRPRLAQKSEVSLLTLGGFAHQIAKFWLIVV